MWANAQRDGRPAEHRWRLCSTPQSLADAHYKMPCSNPAKTRNPLKFAGVPPNYRIDLSRQWAEVRHIMRTWRTYCCLTIFFRLLIRALVAKI